MADEKDIIFKIQIENDNAIAAILAQKEAIKKLKAEQAALDLETDEGKKANEAYNASIKAKTAELNKDQKAVVDNTKAMNTQAGSIEANRLKLSQMTAEYIKLANPTVAQTKALNDLSKELKSQESAIGNNTRNVGNYKEAMANLGGGVGNAIKGVQGFNAALSANPIGAIVQLLSALFNALKGNADVADFVERSMAALNKVFQLAIDTVVKLIDPLKKVFENPKQALLDLVDLIKDNLVNRFKAFGVIVKAITDGDIKGLTNGLIQLGTGVENSIDKVQNMTKELVGTAKAGYDAEKAFDEFRLTQANLNRETALNSKQIQALEKDLKNVGLTLEKRKKVATELATLEVRNAQISQEVAKKILEIETKKLEGKTKSETEKARLIDLGTAYEVAKLDEVTAAANKSKRIALLLKKEELAEKAELNSAGAVEERRHLEELRKGQDEYQKYLDDIAKRDAEASFQLSQFKIEQKIAETESLDEQLQLQQELLMNDYQNDLATHTYTVNEKLLVDEKYKEDKEKLDKDAAKKQIDLDKKTAEKANNIDKTKAQNAINSLNAVSNFSKTLGQEAIGLQKAAGITSALISTYQGAAASLAPPPVGAGPLFGPILAGATIALGVANVASIAAAAGGGDFVTTKPTLLLVGDNPGGRERVTVEPLSGKGKTRVGNSGLIAMAGGGSLTVKSGGMSQVGTSLGSDVFSQIELSKSFAEAFKAIGTPVVSVVDIKKVTNQTNVTEAKARLKA